MNDANNCRPAARTLGQPVALVWLLLVCTAILFMRKHQSFLNPQFWAEDGMFFFTDAREQGLGSLLKPYNGALYLFQRSVAYVGSWLPLRYVPHFYCYTALATTLGVIAHIARSRTDINHKSLLGLAVVACPHNGEIFMTLTNTHWLLALGLIIFLVSRDPPTARRGFLEAVAVGVSCLSGPFVFLFLPLFLVRAWLRKSAFSTSVAVLAVACCGLQWRHLDCDHAPGPLNLHDSFWVGFCGNSLGGMLLLGQDLAYRVPNNVYLLGLSVLLYGSLIAYAFLTRNKTCLTFLWAVGAVLGAAMYSYRGDPRPLVEWGPFRYLYIPYICTAWTLVVVMDRSPRLARPAAFVLILTVLSAGSTFKAPTFPDFHWKQACRGIGGPVPCDVPIPPGGGWRVHYSPK